MRGIPFRLVWRQTERTPRAAFKLLFSMSPFLFRLAPLLCPLAAAAAAPASPHIHAEPLLLDQFVTSAAPFGRNQVDLAQATTVLSGQNLLLKQQPTLGETLAAETGMSATSFGPGASRPLIRGLAGDRVRLLENGVGTLDASIVSPDHAVSIEPFLVERIEVIRGPASLLYGSTAVGGAVNVITHRIEDEMPEARLRGAAEVRHGTAAGEWSRGGLLDVVLHQTAKRALVFHVDGFKRSAGNLRIPGYADSARLRAEETAVAAERGEPPPRFLRGRLANSSLRTDGGAAGLSLVGETFNLGANYSGVNSNYGVPGHGHADASGAADAGTRIELRQRRTDLQGEWRREDAGFNVLRVKAGHANYRHTEIESGGEIGTVFTNQGYDARAEALHGGKDAAWSGALGAQVTRSDFAARGEEAFLPASLTRRAALFAFEEVARDRLTWQFGARLGRTRTRPAGGDERRDQEISGSLGTVWRLDEGHSVALSLAHTERAPNAQELFADGPHAGTQAFEIGDARLRTERSLGAEASLRRRVGFVTGAATLFANRFNGYIFEEPAALIAVEEETGWVQRPADAAGGADGSGALPVYRFVQRDARFHGAEVETLWHLHEAAGRQFDLRLAGDIVRGRESAGRLPRLPAARITTGAACIHGPWSAAAESQFVFRQRATAPGEAQSPGHTLVSVDLGYAFEVGRVHWHAFARGANLADEEVRPHTSFVREIAPLGGRALTLGIRVRF